MGEQMTIRGIVRSKVVTATPTTAVGDIARALEAEGVASVVVVEEARPVGLLTERDLALALADGDAGALAASDVMDDDVVAVDAGTNVFDLVETMESEDARLLPVVDADGDLEGIVTLDDVLALLEGEVRRVADLRRERSPAY